MVDWGELSAREKAEFMRIAIKGGVNKLDDIRELYNSYRGGGSIHIKPSHRGRFTALQERTGKSASWYKAHGTPAQRKMATFALNARRWRHGDGGDLINDDDEYYGGTLPAATITGWLPEVQSPEGKAIARNMAERMVNGNLQLKDVPRRYQSYVQGEAKGAIPMRGYMDKATNVALGTLAVPLATMAIAEAAPAVASSALWSNPITQQIVASEIGGRTVDLLSDSFTGKTWAENMSEGIKGATGWDPSQTWYGNMLSEMTNPGYMLSPSHFFTKEGITRLPQSAFDAGVKALGKNRTYIPQNNSTINEVAEFSQRLQEPVKKEVQQLPPYEIEDLGGGYMLKSLMRGNPLEKQISKQGTVNVNNINALINKGSNIEKAVVEKVLQSEEFAGKKSIDYNKFRKAVQEELVTYDRTPDTRYNDYGISDIGITRFEDLSELKNIENFARSDRFEVVETDTIGQARLWLDKTTGDILNWDGVTQRYLKGNESKAGLNTYTFSSSRLPNGSLKHYDPNTLGHSRTYTTANEPDVLHVMESQSDWAQTYRDPSKEYDTWIDGLQERVDMYQGDLDRGSTIFGVKIDMPLLQDRLNAAKKDLAKAIETRDQLKDRIKHEKYLSDNFTKRQIEENLKFAAERDQTKMRYPTKETAAKIEGYPEFYDYFDSLGNEVNYDTAYGRGEAVEKEILRLEEEIKAVGENLPDVNSSYLGDLDAYEEFIERRSKAAFEMIAHPEDYIDGAAEKILQENLVHRNKLNWMRNHPNEVKELIEKRESLLDQLNKFTLQNPRKLRPGFSEIKKYAPEHETILKKYSEFPKQFKKLYKDADVRTVTDSKGNTWYEVDVPKNYLNQEWEYSRVGDAMQHLSQLPQMMKQPFNQAGQVNINKYPEVQQFINDIYLPILRNEGSLFNMKDSARSILTNEFAENIPIEIKNRISKFLSGTAGVAKSTGDIELGVAPSLKEHFKYIMHEINHIFRKNLAKTDDLNYGELINGNHNGIPYRIAKDMENRFSRFRNKFNERFKHADMLNELSSTSSEIKMDLYIDYFTEHGKYPNAEQLKAYIDELSEEKLTRLFKETNSYGANITNQIKKLDNTERSTANNDLKWLLKNVAILGLPIGIGSQLIDNQGTNNQSWDFTQ